MVSKELIEASGPGAEAYLRETLVRALTLTLNSSFADPANAGVADVEPASIANGAPTVASTGDWAGRPSGAARCLRGRLGDQLLARERRHGIRPFRTEPAEPDDARRRAFGIPTVVSNGVPPGVAVLVDAQQVAYGESELRIDVSTQGTVEMSDAPTGVATYGLWQNNCLGIRSSSI